LSPSAAEAPAALPRTSAEVARRTEIRISVFLRV
jgi:hypothetical protein